MLFTDCRHQPEETQMNIIQCIKHLRSLSFEQSTALESPTLAHTRRSLCSITATAVVPLNVRSMDAGAGASRIFLRGVNGMVKTAQIEARGGASSW